MNSTIFLGRLRSKTTYALNNSIHFLDKIDVLFRIKYKQWPLAGKFVEFEYSPKIRQFCRIRVLAKMTILENRSDSIHSPDIRQPFSPDSIHLPNIRQPFCSDSPDSRKASLATFTRI